MCSWIFLLLFCNLCWALSRDGDHEDWSAGGRDSDWDDYFQLDEGPADDFINAELIIRDEKRSRFGSRQQHHLKHNWLEKFWSSVHKKGLSKRHLSAGEILQILKQASLQRGDEYTRGRLKGIRFGVSKRMLLPF